MAKNDFKPFATGESANVLSQAEFEALDAVENGFQTGIARSEQLNKVWRQASTIASVVASFMADKSGSDVVDNGDIATLQATLLKALLSNSKAQLDSHYLQTEKNLADLNSAEKARGNLGLGSLALKNSLSAADVGAFPAAGGELKGGIWSGTADNYRIIVNNKGVFWRFDGSNYYLMITDSGTPLGSWNSLRPLSIDVSNGNLNTNHHFHAGGNVSAGIGVTASGNIVAGNVVYAGGGTSQMAPDGNIYGSLWGGWLRDWLRGTFVMDIRLGQVESAQAWRGPGYIDQPPYVLTGAQNGNTDEYIDVIYRRPIQKNVNGTWYNVGNA